MFAFIWEFTVKEEHVMKFEEAYGPGGKWAELFKKAEGYIRTELFHNNLEQQKYIMIDYWKSRGYKDDFMMKFTDDYAKIDKECAEFTSDERYKGEFDVT